MDIHKVHDEILLKSVIDSVSDGVTVIDRDLRVVFQNDAIKNRFGDIKGQLCYEAYRKREEPCVDCLVLKVLEDGQHRKILSDTVRPNGDVAWMECASGPLKDSEGNIIGAVEIVRDVTEQMRLSEENTVLKREVERQAEFENIITQSKKMKSLFKVVERIAPTTSSVLLTGESGTGKDLMARAIHRNSNRKDQPFISINCGAIPENLLESELFGHMKGSFTGAIRNHKGLIATADKGTLFLDEVGELPLSLQVKLLRFLQEGTCRPIGDTEFRKFDVRIISATNRNLEEDVKDGIFREDLFFRLSVIPIYLPPLRERKEDIALLANHLLHQLCEAHSRNVSGIDSGALKLFMDYPWPGNVRELQNIIEYTLHLTDDEETISEEFLAGKLKNAGTDNTHPGGFVSIEEYTRQTILALESDHNEEQIAQILSISRKSLWEKRKRWGITRNTK